MDDTTIIDTKENRDLLRKYLYKNFISQGIDKTIAIQQVGKLMVKHNGNLFGNNGLAYSLGSRSFEYFCLHFLQDFFVPKPTNTAEPLADVHYQVWKLLEDMYVNNTHNKQQFILPRGSAKTSIIDMALSCWIHCYRKSIFTLVLANRELDATNFVEQTKIALQTPYIKQTFGELVTPKKRTVNKLELELDNDTKIQAFSSQTSVRGVSYTSSKGRSRPTTILADDYISEADILTDESKDKKYMRWLKEVEEVGEKEVIRDGKVVKSASKFIILGTPLAKGDFIDRIKNSPDYRTFHRPVIPFDVDEYFENNELWQEFKRIYFDDKREFPLEDAKEFYFKNEDEMKFETIWRKYNCWELAKDYFNKRLVFMQELMCDVENIGDKWFKSNRTIPTVEMEENNFVKTMLTIDTAGVKNKDSKRSDSFGFVVGSVSENDFKYIRKAELKKFEEFSEYIDHVIDLLKEFKDITHVFIEKNTYNGLDCEDIKQKVEKDKELASRNIEFINEMQRKNKDEKISTIVSDVNNGRIIFSKENTQPEFLAQVMDFAGQKFSLHDDAPDVLAEFVNRIELIQVIKPIRILDRASFGL